MPVKRGLVVRLSIPKQHTRGREQYGDPWRPYLVLSEGPINEQGMALVVPITTKSTAKSGPFRASVLPFALEDVEGSAPTLKAGYLLVHHVRVVDLQQRQHHVPGEKWIMGAMNRVIMRRVEAALQDIAALGATDLLPDGSMPVTP
mgnify:CR=1 FL=1